MVLGEILGTFLSQLGVQGLGSLLDYAQVSKQMKERATMEAAKSRDELQQDLFSFKEEGALQGAAHGVGPESYQPMAGRLGTLGSMQIRKGELQQDLASQSWFDKLFHPGQAKSKQGKIDWLDQNIKNMLKM